MCIKWLSVHYLRDLESDNGPENENCVIKYADNTVILGLLGENDDHIENFNTSEIDCFNNWCKVNFLNLNVKKIKEMIIDFHEKKPISESSEINNMAIDIVTSYKYLGSIIDNKLNDNENIEKVW